MCAHVYVRAWGLGTRDIHMTKVRDLALALGSLGLAPFSLRLVAKAGRRRSLVWCMKMGQLAHFKLFA